MLQFITLLGKYTGTDKRGIVVGGVALYPGTEHKKVQVNEETYLNLVRGVENGWFDIKEDNYEKFVVSRFRTFTPAMPAKKDVEVEEKATVVEANLAEEPQVEEVQTEEKADEEAPAKKKTSRKKTTKVEE